MGPLRLEWGIPLDRQPGESAINMAFSIGSLF
jgi:outer membrane protein assembly factor BamA